MLYPTDPTEILDSQNQARVVPRGPSVAFGLLSGDLCRNLGPTAQRCHISPVNLCVTVPS